MPPNCCALFRFLVQSGSDSNDSIEDALLKPTKSVVKHLNPKPKNNSKTLTP